MIQLRPHQEACIRNMLACEERFAVAEVTVAGGKSLILGGLAAMNETGRTLIIAHTKELVAQNAEACREVGLRPGICSASIGKNVFARVTIGTVQTLVRRMKYFQDVTHIYVDEVHRTPINKTSSYRRVFDAVPNAKVRGLTGTPFRADGTGSLEKTFGPIIFKYTFLDALKDGWVKPLVPAVAEDVATINTDGVKTVAGDFDMDQLAPRAIQLAPLHAFAVRRTMERMHRNRLLVFACNIAHAETLERELNQKGVRAVAVHSNLKKGRRDVAVEAFRRGEYPALISVAMFDTGFNVPDIDMLVFCRATKSPVFFAQALGRGARVTPVAENCAVLDFGGNVHRHGSLDAIVAAPGSLLICEDCGWQWESWKLGRTCPKCGTVHKTATRCRGCGDRFDQFLHGNLCPYCGMLQSSVKKCAACDELYAPFLHPICPHCGYDNTAIREAGKDLNGHAVGGEFVNMSEILAKEPFQKIIGPPFKVGEKWFLTTKYANAPWPYAIIPGDIDRIFLVRSKNGRVTVKGYYDRAGKIHPF